MKNFFRCITVMKDRAFQNRDRDLARFLLQLENYVVSGEYSSYRRVRELATWMIDGYSDKFIADSLEIKESTLRVNARSVSMELYRLFGDDFFELLGDYNSNKTEVNKRLRLVQMLRNKASTYILRDVLESIEESSKTYVKGNHIYDCQKEIEFLQKYNLQQLRKDLSCLDRNKLIFLRNVLNGVEGTLDEKYYLLGLMSVNTEEEE